MESSATQIGHGVEGLEQYRPGGFYPVHLNDFLDTKQRFHVAHKLGFGESSTVWLCFDNTERLWRAIKVLRADQSSEDQPELKVMRTLCRTAQPKQWQQNHVGAPLEVFWVEGPNGRHLCLVLPLLGPRLEVDNPGDTKLEFLFPRDPNREELYTKLGLDKEEGVMDIGFQITRGLNFLHQRSLCHGDLRPANIRLQYDELDEMSEKHLKILLGNPKMVDVSHGLKHDLHSQPRYLVAPLCLDVLNIFLTRQVSIVGFRSSYEATDTTRAVGGTVCDYSAPERLFHKPKAAWNMPGDVWSLACTLYAVVTGKHLFPAYPSSLIWSLEVLLGPLPARYRAAWRDSKMKTRGHYTCDEDAAPGQDLAPISISAEDCRTNREKILDNSSYDDLLQSQISNVITLQSGGGPQDDIGGEAGQALPHNPATQAASIPQEETQVEADIRRMLQGAGQFLWDHKTGSVTFKLAAKAPAHTKEDDIRTQQKTSSHNNLAISQYSTRKQRLDNTNVIKLPDLLYGMLKYNPEDRIDTQAVLRHSWFGDRLQTAQAIDERKIDYPYPEVIRRRQEEAVTTSDTRREPEVAETSEGRKEQDATATSERRMKEEPVETRDGPIDVERKRKIADVVEEERVSGWSSLHRSSRMAKVEGDIPGGKTPVRRSGRIVKKRTLM
ncbi:kinase-like domain-containing protein [Xylariomycetidae sp. FL2044]|nr:kinase-like domain-containing protein [Xylariomycetidae sp. FL2044]